MAVVSCNTSEAIYIIKIIEKNVAKENLRDRFGHEIFPGEYYLFKGILFAEKYVKKRQSLHKK